MNYKQLASRVRSKYPGQYDDMDDNTLAHAVVKKFPNDYGDTTFNIDVQGPPSEKDPSIAALASKALTTNEVEPSRDKSVSDYVKRLFDATKETMTPPTTMDAVKRLLSPSSGKFGVGRFFEQEGKGIGEAVRDAAMNIATKSAESKPGQAFPVTTSAAGATGSAIIDMISDSLTPSAMQQQVGPVGLEIAKGVVGPLAEKAGVKGLSSVFGPSSDAIEARLANPDAIKNAPTNEELSWKLADKVREISRQAGEYDTKALDTLSSYAPEPLELPPIPERPAPVSGAYGEKYTAPIEETAGRLVPPTPIDPGTAIPKGKIGHVIDNVIYGLENPDGGIVGPAEKKATALLESMKNDIQKVGGGDYISEKGVKGIIESLDSNINWDDQSAAVANNALKNTRQAIDSILKSQNPGYEAAMEPVAERVKAVEDARRLFGLRNEPGQGLVPRDITSNKFGAILRDKNPVSRDALETVSNLTGSDLLGEARNRMFADQFEGGLTNGSRRVNLGGGIGAGAGYLSGVITGHPGIGATVGGVIGSAAGALIDKEGGAMAGKIVDFYLAHKPEVFGKFAPALTAAAARGANALATTQFILSKREPEFQEIMKKIGGNQDEH